MMEHKCSNCDSDFDADAEGGIGGYFGVVPVQFCVWCLSSLHDMAIALEWCRGEEE